jgi:hypothetical protein
MSRQPAQKLCAQQSQKRCGQQREQMIRQRGRELVGNERSDQRSTGISSAITVDHASHAGMKTLAVGSKLTKVGATPTLVSVAALQQTSDDKAPKI